MILTRQYQFLRSVIVAAVVLDGCTNESARAPNPGSYDWPDTFSYRVEDAAETVRDGAVLSRDDETGLLRFVVRNDRYLVWNDSLRRVRSGPAAATGPWRAFSEDTLRSYVPLTRLGEFGAIERGCDPVVTSCRDALPSALPLELRRLIPRLPVWWPPKGYEWVDTLSFDDLPRPGGARGALITAYRDLRDTALGGRAYWLVRWRSVRLASRPSRGAMLADPRVEEYGRVLVDKQRLVPVFAAWYGVLAERQAPGEGSGVTATSYRGRAWLVDSPFDSLMVRR
jgi:hypothetical protein